MKIELADSHLIQNTLTLYQASVQRIEEIAAGFSPGFDGAELEAAKVLALSSLSLIQTLFDAHEIELVLRADLAGMVQRVSERASSVPFRAR